MNTILVVDDSRTMQRVLNEVLGRKGLMPAFAGTAREALELLERHTPDVILVDLVMPGMSGYDLLEELHADARWRHIPTVVVTARNDGDSLDRVRRLGVRDYLVKATYSNADLLSLVRAKLHAKAA